jgi:transposase
MDRNGFCQHCFEKQCAIDKLIAKVTALEAKLRVQKRKASEGFFGSSTPSSKVPLKESSLAENQKKRGGAKVGHPGHGRKKINPDQADEVHTHKAPVDGHCPICGGTDFVDVASKERGIIDSAPVKAKKIVHRLCGKMCTTCHKVIRARAPSVMPNALYGNQLVTNVVTSNLVHGTPLGRLEEIFGIPASAMISIEHRLARLFAGIPALLIEKFRQAVVKHADETSWRTDGANGYAWLFATDQISIFEFRDTRSSSVPAAILGQKRLPGVLVVDRYAGYNRVPCKIQYCYAHLLRNLTDLGKEFSGSQEVNAFVDSAAPLLAAAISLRGQPISDPEYYTQANRIAKQIRKVMNVDAQHLGIRAYQDIFRENKHRLYHWVKDRRVTADNNLAERDLRPTVIARKVSFGSQSEAGAKTRGILMTVFVTLRKQYPNDYVQRFKTALDRLAENTTADPYALLFGSPVL